ncbi:hypothetical protein PQ43W_23 [Ralstonia phage PQ43W]
MQSLTTLQTWSIFMALTDHIAILTHHALAVPVPNKEKQHRLEYYALLAFPPAAANDLAEVARAAIGGAALDNYEVGVKTNAQRGEKALPGVPGDWFIVRAATQFPPYVCDAAGNHMSQAVPEHAAAIRTTFFAGSRVRAALSGYPWNYNSKLGVSFNLSGVMQTAEVGERLNIGSGVVANAFAKHANPAGASVPSSNPAGNPFGQPAPAQVQGFGTGAAGAPQPAQPQQAAAPGGNPFAQPATAGNPFAR